MVGIKKIVKLKMMSEQKQFLYFPSFSSKYSAFKKDDMKFGDNCPTIRFWDDRFPVKYRHKYFLLTAAAFYKSKIDIRETLGLQDSLVFCDSGGFQVANGSLKWNLNLREDIFRWLESNGPNSISMNLDIPPKIEYFGKFRECLEISLDNFEYFHKHQSGKTKFLNVIQGDVDVSSYDVWFNTVKHFDDFRGWGIGSTLLQHYNALYVIALFLKNREFEKIHNEYYHFLGTTSPFNYLIYAVLQKNLNKYYPHAIVTTDSSTPLYQTTYGNWYHSVDYKKLQFNMMYFGNKGRCGYQEQEKLPCIFEDCPVCTHITYDQIANPESHSILAIHMGWHNLFIFTKAVDWFSKLAYGGNDVIQRMFTNDVLTMVKSIDEMFEKPEDAMKIFFKYKPLYVKISNGLTVPTDQNILSSEDIFA
jgi:hypothetical protein